MKRKKNKRRLQTVNSLSKPSKQETQKTINWKKRINKQGEQYAPKYSDIKGLIKTFGESQMHDVSDYIDIK